MKDKASGKITVEGAIRLKHHLNQEITYGGGLNAKQMEEMENLTKEQNAELKRQISEMNKSWWVFPDYFMIIGLFVGVFLFIYSDRKILGTIGFVLFGYCLWSIAYRAGVRYGYLSGYPEGHVEGVHKALGITHDDSRDIRERAIEMEMDEGLIKKMDERKITDEKKSG